MPSLGNIKNVVIISTSFFTGDNLPHKLLTLFGMNSSLLSHPRYLFVALAVHQEDNHEELEICFHFWQERC
jgi:hypothetical protein